MASRGDRTVQGSPVSQRGRGGDEILPADIPPASLRSARADLGHFRFPPSPPLSSPRSPSFPRGIHDQQRAYPEQSPPRPRAQPPPVPPPLNSTRNNRAATLAQERGTTTDQTTTNEPTPEPEDISFAESNVLFMVNRGCPLHRGFGNFAHQLLLNRRSPSAPAVTRTIFWNETFGKYIVQEITVGDGDLSTCAADDGPVRDFPRLLPMQQQADLIVIFTTRVSAALSRRSLLGLERFTAHGLQNVPHILIMANENVNKPSPVEAFQAARHFTNLDHVAVLYQSTPSRDSLGPCQIIHINGCLETLRPRGRFNGRSISDMVEWRDLPELDLEAALERLQLKRNPASPVRTRRSTVGASADRPARRSIINRNSIVSPAVETRAADRVRRISLLLSSPTRDHTVLSALQRELRTHHRTSSSRFSLDGAGFLPPENLYHPPQGPVGNGLRGECQICCDEESQLVFLLKRPTDLPPRSYSAIPWPLAVGALPENDIISAFICCDNCSYYVVEQGHTPIRETLTGALSLIPYSTNKDRWLEDLGRGFSHYGRFSRELLPLVFLAVVEETMRTRSWAKLDGSEENAQRREALIWTRNKLLEQVKMKEDGHDGSLGDWIQKVVTQPKRGTNSMVWHYPLPGFRILLTLSGADQGLRCRITWKRLLLDITRRMRRLLAEEGLDKITLMIGRAKKMVVSNEILENEWMVNLSTEGILPEEVMAEFKPLEQEVRWIEGNGRYAMVVWLGWMLRLPGMQGTTGEVMDAIVEECKGEAVVDRPGEVGRGACR
ncbi:Similar to hypothetical protein [Tuber melanosporum Mel28]; acc. no. XP_002842509 [Pyronema omphalodes CBS 100304]|uniref:Uncharacterized protein n=1 Tax=Pyronema omphalodes (strain CBS 100304) TaxID=1076935 RepID=U4LGP7_PYROM|nr:Similar to hypothetical protein [Tuber melanosporum Mel28]; acc. no. XP_002842509 [Pyronema omphalodes CBS 100304]